MSEDIGTSAARILAQINSRDEDRREEVKKHLTSLVNQSRRKNMHELVYLLLDLRDQVK